MYTSTRLRKLEADEGQLRSRTAGTVKLCCSPRFAIAKPASLRWRSLPIIARGLSVATVAAIINIDREVVAVDRLVTVVRVV